MCGCVWRVRAAILPPGARLWPSAHTPRTVVCVTRGCLQLWRHAFSDVLRAEPSEHPVLLTEPALNPPRNREEMTKVRRV